MRTGGRLPNVGCQMPAMLVLVDGHESPSEIELTLRERVERATDFSAVRTDDGSLVIELSVYPLEDPIRIPAVTVREGMWRRLTRRISGRSSRDTVTVPRGKGER